MPILTDCHLHSSYSGDSEASMEEMIQKGIELGLKEMCFTEHQDFDFVYNNGEPADYFEVNTDSYLYHLLGLRAKYADKVEVSFGIEIGMQSHLSKKLAAYVKGHEFDFVIASSHLCNGKDPYYKEFFEGRDEAEAYHEYFQYVYECIYGFRNFDVYGHLDYILRYGPNKNANFRYEDYKEDIDKILKLLIQNDKGIEVNSSGYKYGLNEPHPCREIIKRYKELGGELITIGSDAHEPSEIAANFDKVREILLDCGFEYYTVYQGRIPQQRKLS